MTAAFYVIGFLDDTRESINATIDYSVALGSTVAQFKMLTPYPGRRCTAHEGGDHRA